MRKKHGRGFIWTKEDEELLIDLYDSKTVNELVGIFERSKGAILVKAKKLGLKRDIKYLTAYLLFQLDLQPRLMGALHPTL